MKKRNLLLSVSLVALVICTAGTLTDSGKAGKTDSPGEGNCSGCHNNTVANAGPGSVTISTNIPNDTYTPGQTYQISVMVSEAGRSCFGFGMEALNATNTNAGTLVVTNATETQLLTASNGRINIVHTLGGGNVSTPGSKTFNFDWTAPPTDIGYVKFHVGSIAGIADSDPATDNCYTTFKSISSPTVTGIEEQPMLASAIYPNPVTNMINLPLAGIVNDRVTVSLYSLTGQKTAELYSSHLSHGMLLQLPVPASISNGIYLVKLEAGNTVISRKVLIQRLVYV